MSTLLTPPSMTLHIVNVSFQLLYDLVTWYCFEKISTHFNFNLNANFVWKRGTKMMCTSVLAKVFNISPISNLLRCFCIVWHLRELVNRSCSIRSLLSTIFNVRASIKNRIRSHITKLPVICKLNGIHQYNTILECEMNFKNKSMISSRKQKLNQLLKLYRYWYFKL